VRCGITVQKPVDCVKIETHCAVPRGTAACSMIPPYYGSTSMDRDQPYAQDLPYGPNNGQWLEQTDYHSHHQPPQHEYSAYAFSAGPVPLAPLYHNPVNIPRTTHQQLQPLIVPAHGWPSMLTSQGSYSQHGLSIQPQLQPAPASASPQLSSSHSTHHTPTPRRTLTDDDRRKMCMFHEEYPTKKQTEIGGERPTRF